MRSLGISLGIKLVPPEQTSIPGDSDYVEKYRTRNIFI